MTYKQDILELLQAVRPDGRCDDCLSDELGIKPRQAVNMACRPLHESGTTTRLKAVCSRCGKDKLVNTLAAPNDFQRVTRAAAPPAPAVLPSRPDIPASPNHQRIGSISNAHVGRDFEDVARAYFLQTEGLVLQSPFSLPVGHGVVTKGHRFDLGSDEPAILVECKSHDWTVTGNVPSAKVTVWNEAMYYFHLAPARFRKVLFVLDARHARHGVSLAEWYVRTNRHLAPPGVVIIEYGVETGVGRVVTW